MGRLLFYGSAVIIFGIAGWFYYQGQQAPDAIMPGVLALFAVMFYGYGLKAKEDGDIGAGASKIKRDRNPTGFKIALYINHALAAGCAVWAIYLMLQ